MRARVSQPAPFPIPYPLLAPLGRGVSRSSACGRCRARLRDLDSARSAAERECPIPMTGRPSLVGGG
jgi:hypothetical protein